MQFKIIIVIAGQLNKPILKLSTSVINLDASNKTLSIDCLPYDHTVTYKWEKRNDEISSRAQGVYSSQLFIANLVPEDSGEYRCIIRNSTGTIASEFAKVVVQGIVQLNEHFVTANCIHSVVDPPKIVTDPISVMVNVCSEATFQCSATGYGKIIITWNKLHDDLPELPETSEVSNSSSGNEVTSFLKITNMVWYYKGIYFCTVKNSAGEVNSKMADLRVSGK